MKLAFYFILLILKFQSFDRVLTSSEIEFYLLKNNLIEVRNFQNEVLEKISFDSQSKDIIDFDNVNDYNFFIDKKNEFYIVQKSGGLVFKSINNKIKRIDKSYDHDMTNFSDVFIKNDTIFKFGGYGYWGARNFFTFFCKKTLEWEYYKTNQSIVPNGIFDFNSSLIDNHYYISNGRFVDINNRLNDKIINKEIWKFDFLSKTWINLGTSNIPKFNLFHNTSLGAIITSDYISKPGNSKEFFFFDFKNNNNSIYKNSSNLVFDNNRSFVENDTLYNIENNLLVKIGLYSIINQNNLIEKSPIYLNTASLFQGLTSTGLIILLVLVSLVIFLKYKRNQMPIISELGLRYKGISYSLDNNEKKILSLIINYEEASSKEIYEIIKDEKLSYPQNNKKKKDTIDKINSKIFKILNIKNFILSKKSTEDQRAIVYFTNDAKKFIKSEK